MAGVREEQKKGSIVEQELHEVRRAMRCYAPALHEDPFYQGLAARERRLSAKVSEKGVPA